MVRWSTPTPQGNDLYSVSGSSAADVWAVGEAGAIVHWDGQSWRQVPSGVQDDLKGVWSAGASDAWAVGSKMTIRHWDGTSWSPAVGVPAPPTGFNPNMGYWTAVWGSGLNDVWIVGDYYVGNASGAMIHWDGSRWTPFTMPEAFGAVWGAGPDDVWALGEQNGLFHWDGQSWTMVSAGVDSGIAIWGASSSDIWSANGGLSHWDGVAVTATVLSKESVEGLWGSSADDVWAVGDLDVGDPFTDPWDDEGLILHWNGLAWEQMPSTGAGFLFGVWGSRSDDVWAVGQSGAIVHWDGRTWSAPEGPPHMVLYSVWGSGPGDVWAFGDDELGLAALHWNGQTWAKAEILDWTALGVSGAADEPEPVAYAVWGSGRDDIWLATDWLNGLPVPATLFVHWDGHSWSLDSSLDVQVAASTRISAMWGNGPNDVWAVGYSLVHQTGVAVHWDGTRWSAVTSLSSTDLAQTFCSVWSSGPNDVWIGAAAAVLHWDGTSWSQSISVPVGAPGYVVGGSGPSDVWAVLPWGPGSPYPSVSSLYSHWNGTSWQDLSGPTLYEFGAMIATSPTNAWLQDGSTVAHWDGTAWTPSDIGSALEIGAGVHGPGPSTFYWDGTQVWTIAADGVIRHP